MPSKTQKSGAFAPKGGLVLALGGMLGALVFVATSFIRLPVPMAQGYVHLGDGVILLGAALLGWVAVPAAALGSMLSDLLLGYVPYLLPTLLIKGAMAAMAVVAMAQKHLWSRVALLLLAEGLMVAGYFVAEGLLMGFGWAVAWADVPGNALQGASGVVVAVLLQPAVGRIRRGL